MAFTSNEASSSSSSSSTSRSCAYHVFLSFRGEDTRKGFTDHLKASLERKGITTFRDDKNLERGEVISAELLKAIEESMFAITVLSPNYASSTWCLDELQKIVECNRKLGLVVMPVFYGVDPSDVRRQRGSFEESFRKHEENFPQESEKVERWRDALRLVAGYSGWDSKDQHEAALVESIAELIQKRLIPKLPSRTGNLVGIDSRVKKMNSFIGPRLNDVRFIGIWGMGGIGKTTIARAVYEAIRGEFEVSCFLDNIREVSNTNGLVPLQRELLSHLNIGSGYFHDLHDGKKVIQSSLCRKRVLLVLDDVSEVNQLEDLAGKEDWFGPGSRVIITTRDMHLLRIHGVHKTYKVAGLVQNEALLLFCLKAFKRDQPEEQYLNLSKEVVKYTGGLPLALEVLGSFLYGRPIHVWHSALKQIRSFPHLKIQDALKISYDGLHPMEKNLFLDIACFFKGMNRNKAIDILEKFGHFPRIGIEVLIERSLVTVEWWSDNLEMHDLLQEMGRSIVFQESPNDRGRHSRLWSQEDIDYVLTNNKGTEAIHSIVLNLLKPYEARWSFEAFSKTSQLKFLSLCNVQLPLGLSCLPNSLKVLHWRGCPLKTLPLTNQPYEVVDINLSCSEIEQLWHGKKILENLKCMDLSFSNNLARSPDFSGVPNLEACVLEGCTSLKEVHPSLVHLKKLVLINLKDCKSLKALPGKLEMSSLVKLNLTGCSKFINLPKFGESMKHLSELSLEGTAIRKLPSSLGCLVGLQVLNVKNCKNLVCLPDTIARLKSLRNLNTCSCSKLCRLTGGLKEKKCSKALCAAGTTTKGRKLSFAGKGPVNLFLHFKWKFRIQAPATRLRLPGSVLNLPSLISMDLSYCSLSEESIPCDSCDLPSLQYLDLSGNIFVSIPVNIPRLSKLVHLKLNWCRKLQLLPELPSSIRKLDASNCDSLETSKFNPCSLFASLQQYTPKVLDSFDMLLSGCEIPSWFVHHEDGGYVSVPHNCAPTETIGIALCFLLISYAKPPELWHYTIECSLAASTGKRAIRRRLLPHMKPGCPHLYILFLTNKQFCDRVHEDSRFGLFDKGKTLPARFGSGTKQAELPKRRPKFKLWRLKLWKKQLLRGPFNFNSTARGVTTISSRKSVLHNKEKVKTFSPFSSESGLQKPLDLKIVRSAARLVCKQDIEH